jgi:hypothetical protein
LLYCSGIFEERLARERRHDPREHVARRVAPEEHVHVV